MVLAGLGESLRVQSSEVCTQCAGICRVHSVLQDRANYKVQGAGPESTKSTLMRVL